MSLTLRHLVRIHTYGTLIEFSTVSTKRKPDLLCSALYEYVITLQFLTGLSLAAHVTDACIQHPHQII